MKYNKYATKRDARARARARTTIVVPFIARIVRFLHNSTRCAPDESILLAGRPQPRALPFAKLAGRLFILFSRGEKEYKVVPRSVGEAVGRAWSAAVYAKPRLASLRLASPACQFACSLATWIPLRVPERDSARLSSARPRSRAHRMVEENWKEA